MHAAGARHATHSNEGARDNTDPKVRFAFRTRAGVTRVVPTLVLDIERFRRKCVCEFAADCVCDSHGFPHRSCRANVKHFVFLFFHHSIP